MKKPPAIEVKIVEVGIRNPKWNYADIYNMFTKTRWFEPCCLKSKPCWECKR